MRFFSNLFKKNKDKPIFSTDPAEEKRQRENALKMEAQNPAP